MLPGTRPVGAPSVRMPVLHQVVGVKFKVSHFSIEITEMHENKWFGGHPRNQNPLTSNINILIHFEPIKSMFPVQNVSSLKMVHNRNRLTS